MKVLVHKQNGFTRRLVAIAALLLIVCIGASIWAIGRDDQSSTGSSASSTLIPQANEVRVYGKVEYIKQGPTDEITGSEPTTATIVVASEADMLTWLQNSPDENSANVLAEAKRPGSVRPFQTPEGTYEVIVQKKTDLLCLLTPLQTTNSDKGYDVHNCRKFNLEASELEADISLIGFGASGILCKETVCQTVVLSHQPQEQ